MSTVRLRRHRALSELSVRDLELVQDNVQHALDQLQLLTTVAASNLAKQLLQGFHVEALVDLSVAPGANIPIAQKRLIGAATWPNTTTLSAAVACCMHIDAQIHLRGIDGTMVPGARAQLYMVDNSGNVIESGPWCPSVPDSTDVSEIVCRLNKKVKLAAGPGTTYAFRYAIELSNNTVPASMRIKAANRTSSPPLAGSHVGGIVIPYT